VILVITESVKRNAVQDCMGKKQDSKVNRAKRAGRVVECKALSSNISTIK
jgi:hypothetical protein